MTGNTMRLEVENSHRRRTKLDPIDARGDGWAETPETSMAVDEGHVSVMSAMEPNLVEEMNQAARTLQRKWRVRKRRTDVDAAYTAMSLHQVINATKVHNQIRDILIYSLFLAFFTEATLYHLKDAGLYHFSHSVKQQVFTSEFNDVGTLPAVYSWLEGPLISTLYNDPSSNITGNTTSGTILGHNLIVGGVRIGQLRSRKLDCTKTTLGSTRIKSINSTLYCYGKNLMDFSTEVESTAAFGKVEPYFEHQGWNNTNTNEERNILFSSSRTHHRSNFPSPAYSVVLPRANKTQALHLVNYLQSNQYLDLQTKALVLDFSIYNPMLTNILVVRAIFEFPSGGGVLPSYSAVVVPFSTNYVVASSNTYLTFLNFAVGCFYIYFIAEEVGRIQKLRLDYFASFSTFVQDVNLLVYALVWVFKILAIYHFPKQLPLSSDTFVNFRYYAEALKTSQYLNACNAFLSWFKMIKYLEIIPQFALVTDTLSEAAAGVSGFLVIFGIVTYAYASAYLLTFGTKLAEYSSMTDTIYTLLRSLLGDFDLQTLVREHHVMGPLLFILFVSVAVFVILNLLIAIISESYEKAQEKYAAKSNVHLIAEVVKFGRASWVYFIITLSERTGFNKTLAEAQEDEAPTDEEDEADVSEKSTKKKKKKKEAKVHPHQLVSKPDKKKRAQSTGFFNRSMGKLVEQAKRMSITPATAIGQKIGNKLGAFGDPSKVENPPEKKPATAGASNINSESLHLLQGMVMQLAHQNERIQNRLEEVLQELGKLKNESKVQRRKQNQHAAPSLPKGVGQHLVAHQESEEEESEEEDLEDQDNTVHSIK